MTLQKTSSGLEKARFEASVSRELTDAVALLHGQRRVLEMIATGQPLNETLLELLRTIESQSPEMLCSIVLMETDGIHLKSLPAPTLPEAFTRAINGAPIGPSAGSCGTAAYRQEQVFVKDTQTDPLWADFRELAAAHGLRACWSSPIFDSRHHLLGTFAIYHRQAVLPNERHIKLIEIATHIAAIAIGKLSEESALRISEARLAAAQRQARIGSWEMDLVNNDGGWSAELYRMFNRDPKSGPTDLPGFLELVHPEDRQELASRYEQTIRTGEISSHEFRGNPAHGPARYFAATSQSVKDAEGRHVHMSGTIQDITARREAEMALKLSESGYKLIRDSNLAGVLISNSSGEITECNDTFLNMVGYTREELNAGALRGDVMTPKEFSAISQQIRSQLAESGACEPCEKEYFRKDGSRVAVLMRAVAFPNRPGQNVVFVIDITHRKRAEEALSENEERFRALFTSAPHAMFVIIDWKINLVNPAMCRLLGATSPDELVGKPVMDLIHPDYHQIVRDRAKDVLSDIPAPPLEEQYLRMDGTPVDVEVNAVMVRFRGRAEIQVIARDITERKRAEAALGAERQFSNTVIDSLPGVFYLVNPQRRLLRWNKNFERVTGRSAEELAIMDTTYLFPPEDLHIIRENVIKVLREGEASVEVSLLTRDKRAVPFFFTGLRVQIGNIQCMAGMGIDISERKLNEAALRESEARYARAVRGTSDGLWDWNIETGEHYLSPRWKELLGFAESDLLDKTDAFKERLHPDDAQRVHAAVQRHWEHYEPFDIELRLRTKSGDYRWYRSRGQVERDTHDRPVRMAGAITDVTERKRTEASLVDSERRLRDAQAVGGIGDWNYDIPTRDIKWSDVLYKIFERDPAKGPPSYEENMAYYYPEDAKRLMSLVERATQTGLSFECDLHLKMPSGRDVWHYGIGHATKNELGQVVALHGTAQDITERKRAEAKLKMSEEQLRALLARLQRAQEEERIRVAREIHDELGQLLTGLKMDVRWIERKISELQNAPNLNPLIDRIVAASELTDTTIAAVQKIAAELRPGALDQLGLAAALTQRARRFQERTGVQCVVKVAESGPPLSSEAASELFYICQEALTNVTRHANAANVEISLRSDSAVAMLEVRDDGCGIQSDAVVAPSSLGLLGMHERALQCGGTISIEPAKEKGTRVLVSIPRTPAKVKNTQNKSV